LEICSKSEAFLKMMVGLQEISQMRSQAVS
jgi:hypothetical protein